MAFPRTDIPISNMRAIGKQIDAINGVDVPLIDVPHTTIQNRAQIIDITNDLSVVGPTKRLVTQQSYRIQDEIGPNGELVFGVLGDKFNQIRFVGLWGTAHEQTLLS